MKYRVVPEDKCVYILSCFQDFVFGFCGVVRFNLDRCNCDRRPCLCQRASARLNQPPPPRCTLVLFARILAFDTPPRARAPVSVYVRLNRLSLGYGCHAQHRNRSGASPDVGGVPGGDRNGQRRRQLPYDAFQGQWPLTRRVYGVTYVGAISFVAEVCVAS